MTFHLRQIADHNLPNNSQIDVKMRMDHSIIQTDDSFPEDVGVDGVDGIRSCVNHLTQDFLFELGLEGFDRHQVYFLG